jgi:hypothetical protein
MFGFRRNALLDIPVRASCLPFLLPSVAQRELVDVNEIICEILTLLNGQATGSSVAMHTELAVGWLTSSKKLYRGEKWYTPAKASTALLGLYIHDDRLGPYAFAQLFPYTDNRTGAINSVTPPGVQGDNYRCARWNTKRKTMTVRQPNVIDDWREEHHRSLQAPQDIEHIGDEFHTKRIVITIVPAKAGSAAFLRVMVGVWNARRVGPQLWLLRWETHWPPLNLRATYPLL